MSNKIVVESRKWNVRYGKKEFGCMNIEYTHVYRFDLLLSSCIHTFFIFFSCPQSLLSVLC